MNSIDRFMKFVNKKGPITKHGKTPCWQWLGSTKVNGYAQFWYDKSNRKGSRFSYEYFIGPIGGLHVLHKCDNKLCVNPKHLFLGTHRNNMDDMLRKGRQAFGDRNGSRLYPERLPRGQDNWKSQHPESSQGERNGNSRLTTKDVLKLRREYTRGVSKKDLANMYGIQWQTVHMIIKRKLWPHI